jgi:hypothetical protein
LSLQCGEKGALMALFRFVSVPHLPISAALLWRRWRDDSAGTRTSRPAWKATSSGCLPTTGWGTRLCCPTFRRWPIVAACLDKYFGEPGVALARYEEIRKERTSMVVRKASENKASDPGDFGQRQTAADRSSRPGEAIGLTPADGSLTACPKRAEP